MVLFESLIHETVPEKPAGGPDYRPDKSTPKPLDYPKSLECFSKSPCIKLQQRERFESTLQKCRRSVETRKKRLMSQREFVTDKNIPVGKVDKDALKEPCS